jgi:hypothetical protein
MVVFLKHIYYFVYNIYLTKSGQNADFWTSWLVLAGRDEGIGGSRRGTEFLKIEIIFFVRFHKNIEKPKNLKIEYISAACRVNPLRLLRSPSLFMDFSLSRNS